MLDHIIIYDACLIRSELLNDITDAYLKAYKKRHVTGFIGTCMLYQCKVKSPKTTFNKAGDSNKRCSWILLQYTRTYFM